ncbi:HEAT repeat domain-containing protein [Magnetospirillum sp. LM-5]|uniref:HEAT repeat domain-containing protein n=1 Tax=Magnetospirillum sp. LM-5 TaxID=2681466 RepID=UPI00156EBCF5|nr:HEAT repeat domain-containing protein [Magnetospirillum sp. LM-5]
MLPSAWTGELHAFSLSQKIGIIAAMSQSQLHLFEQRFPSAKPSSRADGRAPADLCSLPDQELVAGIATAGIAEIFALMAECGRRKLTAAVPALEGICKRFSGFGLNTLIREQAVALEALIEIGGPEAATAVERIIARDMVQGPGLVLAVAAAARTGVTLPPKVTMRLLRHDEPDVRADACRSARLDPDVVAILLDLLDDLHLSVRIAAACALGRFGKVDALEALSEALEAAPSIEVIDALADIADDDAVVLLGRVAQDRPDLTEAVVSALDECGSALAAKVADRVRRLPRSTTAMIGPHDIVVEIDEIPYIGRCELKGKTVVVTSEFGSKAQAVGEFPPDVVAKRLLAALVREAEGHV